MTPGSSPTHPDPPATTREIIVRDWIETERLKLLDKLEWEQWHGWKTVSDPPEIEDGPRPFRSIVRREALDLNQRRAA